MNNDLTLPEIQSESLKVLKKLDEICKNNSITYFLAYGTLIGAIRHQGYIPWDDDVDVWMPRDSYDKFVSLMQSTQNGPFKLCNRDNTKNYTFNIMRFSSMNFIYTNKIPFEKQFDCGVFVDIYPLDYYDDIDNAEKVLKKIKLINKLYSIYLGYTSPKTILRFIYRIVHLCLLILWGNKGATIVKKKEKQAMSKLIDKNHTYMDTFFATEKVRTLKREFFSSSERVRFEDANLCIPVGYDSILRMIYGNYMELPPLEKRQPYHGYSIKKRL